MSNRPVGSRDAWKKEVINLFKAPKCDMDLYTDVYIDVKCRKGSQKGYFAPKIFCLKRMNGWTPTPTHTKSLNNTQKH